MREKRKDLVQNQSEREGSSFVSGSGMPYTVAVYRNAEDVDVVFEDGTVVRHKSWKNAAGGNIRNPNAPRGGTKTDRVGMVFEGVYEMPYEVIAYRGNRDVDIRFKDGFVAQHLKWDNVENGRVWNRNLPYPKSHASEHVGESKEMNCGSVLTITTYRKYTDFDGVFDDGTAVSGKSYGDFKKGQIRNPGLKGRRPS